jgi:GNAT superfamily N-acetyltransferase
MKRMFLRPEARGRGAGRLLAETLVQRAREAGYRRMVLDTLPTMVAAHTMYVSMGFLPTEPYYENPIPGVTFLSLDL